MNITNLKRNKWQIYFGLTLISLSALGYFIHYLIFRDLEHIFIFLVSDIAFVFLEVLLVTLVIHGLLNYREKKAMMGKLNMVIGAFFSEVGTELLMTLSVFDNNLDNIRSNLIFTANFSDKQFKNLIKKAESHDYDVDVKLGSLKELKRFLVEKRNFLLGLLENPNLLEHESFTELLWAVFHLTDELTHRIDLNSLPNSDYAHLSIDATRAYENLIVQWLNYMNHLRVNFPYLYSLSVRTNPFDKKATPEVVKA